MKQYYECHITMQGNPDLIKDATESIGWKFSKIDGDIDLGDGVKCYATMHFSIRHMEEFIIDKVRTAAKRIRSCQGNDIEIFRLLRTKVELIIFDSKQEVA